MNLADILKDSDYKLSQFKLEEVDWLEESIFLKQTKKGETPYIKCLVKGTDRQLTPEEIVRQLYLKVLLDRYGYPADQVRVEYEVVFGREKKRADIAVMDADRPTVPYIIVELKKPKEKDGKDQLKSYCNATGAPIGVWTNGDAISRWHRKDPNYFERITDIPRVTQTLEDILQIKFTLNDLIANDRLVQEKKSLRSLIEEMEDEVLANAGVDVFEEVFKLIFTKLYDEWLSGQGNNRHTRILEFRNTGQTEGALKTKIQKLFNDAKEKWEGVFSEDAKITLTPSHLAVCVRSLENVKLFNSNLDVIDEAFEYLVNQSSKGEKGQYFTPRYVIDLCVKMLNPKEDEYMIDTAGGSSGFPVHTIFHVWKQILEDEGLQASHLFTMEDKPHRCYDYVQKRVFAIDFDEKSVRVARTLNLIAGDGQTNVLHLNTLDFDLWDEITKDEDWTDTYNDGFKRLKKLRVDKGSYKEFEFDVLMANPPFAGDIKESRILARYDLGKKPDGKWLTKVGRDILFIERNLDFLKPGGRMAIVLPQGRFNNSSDKYIRDYIAERCRILAVVGLHGNTFKPHTGTKTSVLFVQKWNDEPKAGALCPRQEDYNIFFATMRRSGKDNSGEKIYRRIVPKEEEGLSEREKDREFLLDPHDHLIVDHDLYNHEGLTEDGIAEAFIEFAKKEKLSFFEIPPACATPLKKGGMGGFDAVRYQRLMDGLEAVEEKFSSIDLDTLRLDSEYFSKDNQSLMNALVGTRCLTSVNDVAKVITDMGAFSLYRSEYFVEDGIPFLRVENIKNNYLDLSDTLFISESYHNLLKKSNVLPRDVLLTTKAVIGMSTTVPENIGECNMSQNLVRIRLKEEIVNPYFLSTFLSSKYGKFQSNRLATGNVQLYLNFQNIKKILLPRLSISFQGYVEKVIKESETIRYASSKFYQQAEDLLLAELGLKDWQPTEENIAVKSFAASFGISDRLDAEYYQPNQQKIISVMSQSGLCIKDIAKLMKRKFIPENQGSFHYIEIGNLSGEGFANSDVVPMDEAPSRAQWIVNTNDVITSTVRPIRRLTALIEPEQNNYICSSGFAVLKPINVEPEVLLVYLRLPVVCEILDLHTTASMYPAINPALIELASCLMHKQ
ncbi:MAG: N-6 DNA methylase [Leptolyngbyaceae cyanobacterium bins.302]|nr:N-6 DNA methylase [Leptolyngbyaceae cyanobacterium bins.302]